MLLLVSCTLYWLLVRSFEKENIGALTDLVHVVRVILKELPNDLVALRREVDWEVAARRTAKYYVRILDEQDQMIIETPGMEKTVSPRLFPAPVGVDQVPEKALRIMGQNRRTFLLMATWDQDRKSTRLNSSH